MNSPPLPAWTETLRQLNASDASYATQFVDALLQQAQRSRASDVHLQPAPDGVEIRFRVDGALQHLGRFPAGQASDLIARLKVLAGLLTYRTDVPQEGRLPAREDGLEMRVSTFPTLYGERAVVRLFGSERSFQRLEELGLSDDDLARLRHWLQARSGAIIIAGPAGAGKTTTAYACLREIADQSDGQRCIVTLEDPIESALEGVVQSQVNNAAGFDLETGLRSLVRQDPEAIMIGEIRDPVAAETVISASLTGHIVITTYHAEDGAGAISRLLEMGVPPYLVRSGVRAVIAQRLVRRLCSCAQWSEDEASRLELPAARWKKAVGCERCGGSGYVGRRLISQFFALDSGPVRDAVLARGDQKQIAAAAEEGGARSLSALAVDAVEAGETSPDEVRRVFGFFGFGDADRRSGL